MKKYANSLTSVLFASLVFTAGFVALGLFWEGYQFRLGAVTGIVIIYIFSDFLMVLLINVYRSLFPQDIAAVANGPENPPDLQKKMTFHWSLTLGVTAILLTAGTYALINYLLEQQSYYTYMIIALAPLSPWMGSMSLKGDRQLTDGTSLTTLFFHI